MLWRIRHLHVGKTKTMRRLRSTEDVNRNDARCGGKMRRRNASHLGETPRDLWRFVFCNRQACCARHCNPSRTCHGSMEGRGGGEHGSWAVVKRLRQGARASDHQGPAASSIRRVSMRACSNPTQITSFSVYYHDITVTFLSREHNYICK